MQSEPLFNRNQGLWTELKGGFHDSEHVHGSKYCFSPVHTEASMQASSFNCIANEPIRSK